MKLSRAFSRFLVFSAAVFAVALAVAAALAERWMRRKMDVHRIVLELAHECVGELKQLEAEGRLSRH